MKFVALDVETANADMASICSVGLATFEDGYLVSEWYTLIDPQDYFSPMNVAIHGIDEAAVVGAPTYLQAAATLEPLLHQNVVVTHTHFDRVALHQAAQRWGMEPISCTWLDSSRVCRRIWDDCAKSGYGLKDLCKRINHQFQHHNALEDAKAAGRVLLAAMGDCGLDLQGVLRRVEQRADPIKRGGDPNGPLAGEVVVFTGALQIPRREAADLAASVGLEVAPGVTKRTTMLVVGDIDVAKLSGHEKSSKHRKAEELAASGQAIKIVRETDFRELVALT